MAGPFDVGGTLQVTGGDGITADGRENRGVGEVGLGSDDTVRDVVVDSLRFESFGLVSYACTTPGGMEEGGWMNG